LIKAIDHINIVVRDLAETKSFFKHFGFQSEDEALLEGKWLSESAGFENVRARYGLLSLPESDTTIHVMEYINPPSTVAPEISMSNRIGFRHPAFRVENIKKMVRDLKKRGARFISEIQTHTKNNKKVVYFFGPDGIILRLTEYN
jgi:catechol 2,3-dioxygenase-like lactoylglutathione lyase family enzyme